MITTIRVPVGTKMVTARAYAASERRGLLFVLAHGAGADQSHPFMVRYAEGLAARGIDTMTFNFLYTEEKRPTPDRTAQLEGCYRAVIDVARRSFDGALVIGGKSMGGRIASHLAAEGVPGLRALVLLGYPLHPPAKPEQLRVAHLHRIQVPSLFVQGTRDAFGGPDDLRPHLAGMRDARILPIEGGDHSFAVPKKSGKTPDQVHDAILGAIADFLR
jgi:hypothetical protein